MLVRKIERGKWDKHIDKFKKDDIVNPYIITNDLRTCENNTLSVWRTVIDDKRTIENIVLCLANSRQKLQSLQIVKISEKALLDAGVKLEDTEGDSAFEEYNTLHVNMADLSISDIINITKSIYNSIEDNGEIKVVYRERDLIELFVSRVNEGDIDPRNIKDKIKESILNKAPKWGLDVSNFS